MYFSRSIVGYTLLEVLLYYKSSVLRGDLVAARELLPGIPMEHHNRYTMLTSTNYSILLNDKVVRVLAVVQDRNFSCFKLKFATFNMKNTNDE